ncbi:MAG: hypothetical protein OEQ39_13075, partial [Gammaproteobacteria bacterium]|nr:hypothetical protein [Gammaproteobacteria bacterium]
MSHEFAIRIFALIPMGVAVWFVPTHWAGVLILYLSAEIVSHDRLIQDDRKLLVIAIGTVAIHGCAAVVDALWWPIPVAQPDPDTFFRVASQIANRGDFVLGIDYVFFENVLALFHVVGGNSRLLGNALSVFWYAGSCIILMRLIRVLGIDRYRYGLLIGFGLLPSALLLRAMTLRESWLLFLFMV